VPKNSLKIAPTTIRSYYDINVRGKLNGFTLGNPRIEMAWNTIRRHTLYPPGNVLELGCGIGDVSWRMSTIWPLSNITGVDISPVSIAFANKLFNSPKLKFLTGTLEAVNFTRQFDLIVMVDVYEHIAVEDRYKLHSTIKNLLTQNGRLILTFPTPGHQNWLRNNALDLIQPIDEDITQEVILTLARETGTRIILYQEVSIWHDGDYAHVVLESISPWKHQPVPAPKKVCWWKKIREIFPPPPPAYFPSLETRKKLANKQLGSDADIEEFLSSTLEKLSSQK
jgi:SAM-dependent methyltransferase